MAAWSQLEDTAVGWSRFGAGLTKSWPRVFTDEEFKSSFEHLIHQEASSARSLAAGGQRLPSVVPYLMFSSFQIEA